MLDPVILGKYIEFCGKVRKLKQRTLYEYLYIIRLVANYFDVLEAKKPSEVESAILKAKESGTVVWGDNYTYKVSFVFSVFYKWAVSEEIIPYNPYPFNRFKKPKLKEPKYLTEEQYQQIITLPCLTLQQKTYLMLVWETGVRRGELLALNRSDVELKLKGDSRNGITVRQEISKGEYGGRYVPLPEHAAFVLFQHISNIEKHARGPWLFVDSEMNRLGTTTIDREVREIGHIKTSTKEPCKLHLHALRHSLGARLTSIGYPESYVQKILGHSTQHMTLHYIHYSKDKMDEMRQKAESSIPKESTFATNSVDHKLLNAILGNPSPFQNTSDLDKSKIETINKLA